LVLLSLQIQGTIHRGKSGRKSGRSKQWLLLVLVLVPTLELPSEALLASSLAWTLQLAPKEVPDQVARLDQHVPSWGLPNILEH